VNPAINGLRQGLLRNGNADRARQKSGNQRPSSRDLLGAFTNLNQIQNFSGKFDPRTSITSHNTMLRSGISQDLTVAKDQLVPPGVRT
jgi:hypothetical protein